MDWIVTILGLILLLSVGIGIFKAIFDSIIKLMGWVLGPKEWFSGTLARGSFRPRIWTVLVFLLMVLLLLGLLAFAFLGGILVVEWLGMLSFIGLVFLPDSLKKIWSWLRKREQATIQSQRDHAAMELSRSIPTGNEHMQKYSLYLRPFTSTGKIPICVVRSTMTIKYPAVVGKERTEEHTEFVDLETLLAMAVCTYAPLVALGRPGEQVGAGRILSTDDTWQSEFSRLSASAEIIFLLPSSMPGTRWELNNILANKSLLSKTIFLIPPTVTERKPFPLSMRFVSKKPSLFFTADGVSDIHGDAICALESEADSAYFSLIGDILKKEGIVEEGALFCFIPNDSGIAFSSPLVTFANPSPLRFLIDLWLSRETVVVSRSAFGKRVLGAINAIARRGSRTRVSNADAAL